MRIGRIFGAVAMSWFFGLGGGLASLGEWQYACAWLAALPIAALLAAFVSPWAIALGLIAWLGATAHAVAIARKSDTPIRVLLWMPWACIVANVSVALFVRGFAVEAFTIPASSMIPTLEIGDHIFIE